MPWKWCGVRIASTFNRLKIAFRIAHGIVADAEKMSSVPTEKGERESERTIQNSEGIYDRKH